MLPSKGAQPGELRVVDQQRGELRGIQVRYRWNGAEWLDTLLGLDSVVRIVRTRLFDA
jgi:hypothetical protein